MKPYRDRTHDVIRQSRSRDRYARRVQGVDTHYVIIEHKNGGIIADEGVWTGYIGFTDIRGFNIEVGSHQSEKKARGDV